MTRSYLGFGLALVVQVALLAAVPWRPAGRTAAARLVWLKASAADRRDVLQGDYLDLRYEIAGAAAVTGVAGLPRAGDPVTVILAETAPGVWETLGAQPRLPEALRDDQVALRGQVVDRGEEVRAYLRRDGDGAWTADSVVTGRGEPEPAAEHPSPDRALARAWIRRTAVTFPDIESYFVPESGRARLAQDLRAHPDEVAAQVAVDPDGRAALRQVRVQDRVYDF